MANKFKVHANGAFIEITNSQVIWEYVGGKTETYPRSEAWLQKFFTCRCCGKEQTLERAAYAIWKLQQEVCGTDCHNTEIAKSYACCPKAKRMNCVCMYAFTCETHGERHVGTHD